MRNRYLVFGLAALSLGAAAFFAVQSAVLAQEPLSPSPEKLSQIQYPVAELGNCGNQDECSQYCDTEKNQSACLDYAAAHELMPQGEIEKARKVVGKTGPGGCTGRKCETFCNDIKNIDACVTFAEENGLMSGDELAEAKLVKAAILEKGLKTPGGCGNKKACDAYCGSGEPGHMRECIAFAKEAGFMKPEEQADAEKMLAALERGVKPLPCKGKDECDAYCDVDEHFEECITFAEGAGFIDPKDAEMARKTGGKGPGGCKRDECKTYCDDPTHEEECFKFAEEHDLIPPEDKARMQEGMQKFREGLEQASPEVKECLRNTVGSEVLDQIAAGTKRPSRDLGDKMRSCFEQFMKPPQGMGGPKGGMPPEVEACLEAKGIDFENLEGPPPEDVIRECFQQFGPQGMPGEGQMMGPPGQGGFPGGPGGFSGPGGCTTPEECQSFCSSNPKACKGFGPSNEGGMMQGPPSEFGMPPGMSPEEFKNFQGMEPGQLSPEQMQQFKEQYNQQYHEQFQSQFPKGSYPGGPPEGGYPSYPGGQFGPPPEGGQYQGGFPEKQYPPQGGQFPEGGSFSSPPEGSGSGPPPQSLKSVNPPSLLGFFAQIFLGIDVAE